MTEPRPRLTLPEDADPAALALAAAELAIDAACEAEATGSRASWAKAEQLYHDAAYYCAEAAAALRRAERGRQEARGLIECGHCGKFRRPEEMDEIPVGYQRKGAQEIPPSVYRSCRGGCHG